MVLIDNFYVFFSGVCVWPQLRSEALRMPAVELEQNNLDYFAKMSHAKRLIKIHTILHRHNREKAPMQTGSFFLKMK